jgi:dTDP-4-dehydrorhamnose 3,5-epimerase
MKLHPTPIEGCFEVSLSPRQDERGAFVRQFCEKELREQGISFQVQQSNFSATRSAGTIRGLHYQTPPMAESKLLRVLRGKVFDVCVDLRKNSKTFGQWHGVELSDDHQKMFFIPKGCAHGFQTLAENCEMVYFHDAAYSPDHDRVLNFADPSVAIRWPKPIGLVSDKDRSAPMLDSLKGGLVL